MTRPPRLTPIHVMREPDGTPCIGCDALSHELAHLHHENLRMTGALADARAEAEWLRAQLAVLGESVRQIALGAAATSDEGAEPPADASPAR